MDEINNENDRIIYEVGYHLLPNIEESEVLAQLSSLKSIIETNNGFIFAEGAPKMIVLAYDLIKNVDSKKQKFKKSYFGWVKFEMDPAQIADLKVGLENLPSVLRFIIIKTVREDTMHVPKIPMFKKDNTIGKEEHGVELDEKVKISEEEIDKSIDSLVIEN